MSFLHLGVIELRLCVALTSGVLYFKNVYDENSADTEVTYASSM